MKRLAQFAAAAAAAAAFVLCGCGGNGIVTPAAFPVGGTVVNLAGMNGGLVLEDNQGDQVPVNANGSFQFSTAYGGGTAYSVTILTQPTSPTQICGVTNGSGTVNGDVTNIQVNCGHNEWTWASGATVVNQDGVYGTMGTASMNNAPGARQISVNWLDASGNEWLFGGYGYDSVGTLLPMNDLWKYSGGEWTWMGGSNLGGQKGTYGAEGTANAANIPGARSMGASSTDTQGNVWVFGGEGYDSVGTEASLNDLWKYSNGEWTWMAGSNIASQKGTYGTRGVASASNSPGARIQTVSWADGSGNFWLFGGIGFDSNGTQGSLNDLWEFSGGEWMWVSGSNVVNQNGVYGTQSMAAAGNVPGAREWSFTWAEKNGDLWLFGGQGYPENGGAGDLSDLWKFSNGEWTWVNGSKLVYQAGTYGTAGTPALTNIPGSRLAGVSWVDSKGNLWLFGGAGMDSNGTAGELNDVWRFDNVNWTWVSGARIVNQVAIYGTKGTPALQNVPGGRFISGGWVDQSGNLVLMGGNGYAAVGPVGNLNDLWTYLP